MNQLQQLWDTEQSNTAAYFAELTDDTARTMQATEEQAVLIRGTAATSALLGNQVDRSSDEAESTSEGLRNVIGSLENERSIITAESDLIQQDSKAINSENTAIKEKTLSLWQRMQETMADIDSLHAVKSTVQNQINDIEAEIMANGIHSRDLRIKIERARQVIRDELAVYPEQSPEIAEEIDPVIIELKKQLDLKNRAHESSESALAREQIKREELQSKVNAKLSQLSGYQQELRGLNVRLSSNQELQQAMEASNADLAERLATIQKRIKALGAFILSVGKTDTDENPVEPEEKIESAFHTTDAEQVEIPEPRTDQEQSPFIPATISYRDHEGNSGVADYELLMQPNGGQVLVLQEIGAVGR